MPLPDRNGKCSSQVRGELLGRGLLRVWLASCVLSDIVCGCNSVKEEWRFFCLSAFAIARSPLFLLHFLFGMGYVPPRGGACLSHTCIAGACTGNCVPGQKDCTDLVPRICDATGSWQSKPSCDDGNPCTVDSCSAGVCGNTPSPAGTSCGDGNACPMAGVQNPRKASFLRSPRPRSGSSSTRIATSLTGGSTLCRLPWSVGPEHRDDRHERRLMPSSA